jgi:uncharacterized protein YbjT (DUF2867 family)
VIRALPMLDTPAARLIAAAAAAGGATVSTGTGRPIASGDVLVVSSSPVPLPEVAQALREAGAAGARVLVLGRLGVHRDARAAALRQLWDIEERARGCGAPALALRVGPLLGPASPLWRWLATRPRLPRGGTKLVNPVAEDDAVETLRRALTGAVAWDGWFEVAGPEPWTLAELVALAGGAAITGDGACEPPMDEIEEHRLADPGPWLAHFGVTPGPVSERARVWSAAA